jgi:hypothetical protein
MLVMKVVRFSLFRKFNRGELLPKLAFVEI